MIDLGKVEKLMSLMAQYGVDVVQAETGPEKIALAKNANAMAAMSALSSASASELSGTRVAANPTASSASAALPVSAAATSPAAPAAASSTPAAAKPIPEGTTISSPFVGTFYRSPSPDSPVFVDIGTRVKKGQTLCIVEAMKLMNEIESELDGEVVGILVDNAKPVEFGTPLFVIRP
ncbi:acetyl-CoA carboxylase biotin carboxyl carrier protein [bacterium]|nr:acetyl-CoA carboxylase biotin carboxyl carrier protein [bacterium]